MLLLDFERADQRERLTGTVPPVGRALVDRPDPRGEHRRGPWPHPLPAARTVGLGRWLAVTWLDPEPDGSNARRSWRRLL
jgi:hypothetical protein